MVNDMNPDKKDGKVKEVKQVFVSMEEGGEELDVLETLKSNTTKLAAQRKRMEKLID